MSLGKVVTSAVVHSWHCDHFGHMNTRHYAAMFDDAVFLFWGQLGAVQAHPGEAHTVPVTAQMTTAFLSEAQVGTLVQISASIKRVGGKSATLLLNMRDARSGAQLATCEVVEVFFDTASRSSQAIPEPLRARLLELSEHGE